MNYPKYAVESSYDLDIFEFISKGLQGEIIKTVQFSPTQNPNLFNLGFGDKRIDGSFDDNSIFCNGDMEKVLATVPTAVYEYTSNYPERNIIFFRQFGGKNKIIQNGNFKKLRRVKQRFSYFWSD